MTTETYNGWTNYETWAVALWLNSDQTTQLYWREQAKQHIERAPTCQMVLDGVRNTEDAAKYNLADQLKEEIEGNAPEVFAGAYSDLLRAALAEVDWQEIAQSYLPKVGCETSSVLGPVIFPYTRAQAIADGVLIDVTEMAREAGIKHPTALTATAWAQYVQVPEGVETQDEKGRLWDILSMFRFAAMQAVSGSELRFKVAVRNDNFAPILVTLKAICGPGDTLDPVLTILLPDED